MIAPPALLPLDDRFEQLRGLSEIGRALTYATTLDQVARLTVERGAGLLKASAGVLMLSDSDGLLQVRGAHGVPEERVARFRAPLSDDVIGRLQGMFGVPDDCFIAVPLVVRGTVTGVLAVALRQAFTDADEWLLSALGDQAALALENARLAGEVRDELEARLRASEGSTNAKDRALETLAHDIRTPLGAISGYCDLLDEGVLGPVTDRQRDALGKIKMSGLHLLSLLDNVMDIARLHAGVLKLSLEPVQLVDVARESLHMLAPASAAKLQTLKLVAPVDVVAMGNHARVRQVLVNLLGNAVKFTPQDGTITIRVAERRLPDGSWGEISVTDTGPGIASAERAAIFEPYYRSQSTARLPGVGLGLAISDALVTQMGGALIVDSELGAGSVFTIRLPLPTEAALAH